MHLQPDRSRISQLVAAEMKYFGSRYALALVAGSAALVSLVTVLFSVFYYIGQSGNDIDYHFMAAACATLGVLVGGCIAYRIWIALHGPRMGAAMFFSAFCCLVSALSGFIFVRTILRWQLPDMARSAYDHFIRSVLTWPFVFPLLVLLFSFALLYIRAERPLPYLGWSYVFYILVPLSILPAAACCARFCTVDNLYSVTTVTTVLYLSFNLGLAVHFLFKAVLNRLLVSTPSKYETFIKARHSIPKPGEVKVTAADLDAVRRALQEGEALPDLKAAPSSSQTESAEVTAESTLDEKADTATSAGDESDTVSYSEQTADAAQRPDSAAEAEIVSEEETEEPAPAGEHGELQTDSAAQAESLTNEAQVAAACNEPEKSDNTEKLPADEEAENPDAPGNAEAPAAQDDSAVRQGSAGASSPGVVRIGARRGVRSLYRYILPRGYHMDKKPNRAADVEQIILRVHPIKEDSLSEAADLPPELQGEYQDFPTAKPVKKTKRKYFKASPAQPSAQESKGEPGAIQSSAGKPDALEEEKETAVKVPVATVSPEESMPQPVSDNAVERGDSCCDLPDEGTTKPHNGRDWFEDIQRQLESLSNGKISLDLSTGRSRSAENNTESVSYDMTPSEKASLDEAMSENTADAESAETDGEEACVLEESLNEEPDGTADTQALEETKSKPETDEKADAQDNQIDRDAAEFDNALSDAEPVADPESAETDGEEVGVLEESPSEEPDDTADTQSLEEAEDEEDCQEEECGKNESEDTAKEPSAPVAPQNASVSRAAKRRRKAPYKNDEPDIVELLDEEEPEKLTPSADPASEEELVEILEDITLEPPEGPKLKDESGPNSQG